MNRHMIPILNDMLTPGEIVRVSGSPEELAMYDEAIANCVAKEALAKGLDSGKVYDPEQVFAEIQKLKDSYKRQGKSRLISLKEIDLTEYDIEFYTDDEKFDAQSAASNLVASLKIAPEYKDLVMRELFDIMGLDSSKIPQPQAAAPTPVQPALGPAGQQPMPNPAEAAMAAVGADAGAGAAPAPTPSY